jgi:ABC-2 type transport system permease protein
VSVGALTVYRIELRKLRAQKRTYLGLAAAAIAPIVFVSALALQSGSPNDVPLGREVRDSGLAIPLVLLVFGSIWLFPLIAALVAGDIVAAEDGGGTLKTILTRSADRGQIFAGKLLASLTYTALAILTLGGIGMVAGILESGWHPLTTLSGTSVSPERAFVLTLASLAIYLIPLGTITCIGVLLSTVTRNSAGAVVDTLLIALLFQLIQILPGLNGLTPYLLTTQFDAWHGLLRTPLDWAPIVRAVWVCALYAIPAVVAAVLVFLRRDVAGG